MRWSDQGNPLGLIFFNKQTKCAWGNKETLMGVANKGRGEEDTDRLEVEESSDPGLKLWLSYQFKYLLI